jgi:hypothetical protein
VKLVQACESGRYDVSQQSNSLQRHTTGLGAGQCLCCVDDYEEERGPCSSTFQAKLTTSLEQRDGKALRSGGGMPSVSSLPSRWHATVLLNQCMANGCSGRTQPTAGVRLSKDAETRSALCGW